MAQVIITDDAQADFDNLPVRIQARMNEVFARLVNWPAVSGAKPLRGNLAGNFRIRTGDYRVVFSVSADKTRVTVWKIGNRGGVYE